MAITGYENADYRWRQGFVNAAQLTATYNLTAFARTSDMSGYSWLRPEGNNVYNRAALREFSLPRGGKFTGNANFLWILPRLTPQMTNFILYDATMFNGTGSMDCTVSTWNGARDRWEVVWAVAAIDLISQGAIPGFWRGFRSLDVTFRVLQDAP